MRKVSGQHHRCSPVNKRQLSLSVRGGPKMSEVARLWGPETAARRPSTEDSLEPIALEARLAEARARRTQVLAAKSGNPAPIPAPPAVPIAAARAFPHEPPAFLTGLAAGVIAAALGVFWIVDPFAAPTTDDSAPQAITVPPAARAARRLLAAASAGHGRFPARRSGGRSCRPDRLSAGARRSRRPPGKQPMQRWWTRDCARSPGPGAPSAGNHGPAIASFPARAGAPIPPPMRPPSAMFRWRFVPR